MQKQYKIYTVKRTEAQSSPSQMFLGYFDDAAGMTQGSSDFDTFFAYRPVLLNTQGQVTAELNPNNYAEDINGNPVDITGGGGNVMVEFPRRGIKMSKEGDVVTLSITDNPDAEADGFQYFAHSRGTFENPIKKDKFYLGAYKGFISVSNQRLQSWSGQRPTGNTTLANFILAARRNDVTGVAGHELQGFYQRMYIIALYFMKYGNPDSQSVIGLGYTGGNSVPNTGATNTIGMTGATGVGGLSRVKLFGLEDIWGAAHEFVAGVKTGLEADGFPLYTALSNFNDTVGGDYGGYTNQGAGVVLGRQNRNITKIVGDNYKMFAAAENVNNTNYDTYYCDNAQVLENRVCIAGQSYDGGKAAGITRIYLGTIPSSTSSVNVGRLMYL